MGKNFSGSDYQNRGSIVNAPSYAFNAYLDAGVWKYKTSNYAFKIEFDNSTGLMTFYTAPSGLADATITWTGRQILTPAGLLKLGANAMNAGIMSLDNIGNTSLVLTDDTAIAANIGGGVFFGGKYTGSTKTTWASIVGLKENATDGEYGGYLQFLTRPNGGSHTERMRITPAGVVSLILGQLKFPATANPSSDANTLDDYEEGTAIVAFSSSTGTITISATYNTLKYTKIGNKIHLTGYLEVGSVSSPTGTWKVTGLPFTNGNNLGQNRTSCSISAGEFDTGFLAGSVQARLKQNATEIEIIKLTDGVLADMAQDVKAGSQLYLNINYFV